MHSVTSISGSRQNRPRDAQYGGDVPELTGDFNTGKLPKIAPGAVTVAIARTIDPANRDDFLVWCDDMLAAVQAAPGCLGATNLAPARDGDAYHMVFRFVDVLHLRQWEKSDVRQQLRDRADTLVRSERVTVTAGEETFFDALSDVEPHRSRVGKFLADIAWVYPVAFLSSVWLAPALAEIDLVWRVMASTAIIGLTTRFTIRPVRKWWRRRRMLPQNNEIIRR